MHAILPRSECAAPAARPSRRLSAAVLAAAALAAGCLRVDEDIVLNADGTGHLTARYTVAPAMLDRIAAAARSATNQPGVPPPAGAAALLQIDEASVRKEFSAFSDLGLSLRDLRVEETGGVRSVRVEVDFRDLAGLARSEFFASPALTLTQAPSGHFVLSQEAPLAQSLAGDLRARPGEVDAAMAALFKDFQATIRVTVPGDIVATSAASRSGRTAAWTFDVARAPGDFARARTQPLTVEFKGDGLTRLAPVGPGSEPARTGTKRGGT